MGKKIKAAQASLVAAFLAAGGAATQAGAAALPDSADVMGVVSSHFGPMDLMNKFQDQFLKLDVTNSFQKYYKDSRPNAISFVQKFSSKYEVAPPPGFEFEGATARSASRSSPAAPGAGALGSRL